MAVNDAAVKERLQQLGAIDCLVRVICTDCVLSGKASAAQGTPEVLRDPSPPSLLAKHGSSSSAQGAGRASLEATATGAASLGWDGSHGATGAGASGSDPEPLPDGREGWRRLWAAALMGAVLGRSNGEEASQGPRGSEGGEDVQQEVDAWEGVSASATSIYSLLLPLQVRPRTCAHSFWCFVVYGWM